MARKSREEKQAKRALEELSAAISRKDAEWAVTNLLQLSPAERAEKLSSVARLFIAEVVHNHCCGNWSRLDFWAARAEREPRLLQAEADNSNTVHCAVWALLWARARSKQWRQARLHASALVGLLPERLQHAVDVYLAADGAPEPELYREFSTLECSDPRLGYDKGQRTAAIPCEPVEPLQVEGAVLACAALCSSDRFTEVVSRWADASPLLAPAILTLAVRLQRGEILSRMHKGVTALEPAKAMAVFLQRLQFPPDLETEMELALRVAGALWRDRTGRLEQREARGFASIVEMATAYPRLRSSALALAVNMTLLRDSKGDTACEDLSKEAEVVAMGLLQNLCRLPGSEMLLLQALLIWASSNSPGDTPPHWISSGLSSLLDRPGELARCLDQAPEHLPKAFIVIGPLALSPQDGEKLFEQAWDWAGDSLKPLLLQVFDKLLLRARGQEASKSLPAVKRALLEMAYDMGFDPDIDGPGALEQILSSPMAKNLLQGMISEDEDGPLPPVARRIWDRFSDRVIPFDISYLEMALEQGGRKPQRMLAVERYLGERVRNIQAVFEAIVLAEHRWSRLASKALLDHLLGWLKGDWEGLATALLEASRRRLRRGIRSPLARAFEEADIRAIAEGRTESVAVTSARLELRLLRNSARPKKASSIGTRKQRRRKSQPRAQ
jgi:hypothetical protein